MKRVLVVDDEENIGRSLRLILEREGYGVDAVLVDPAPRHGPGRAALDAYLLDVRLPDGNGIDLLRHFRQAGSDAPAVMISGHGTIADAVEATRAGRFRFPRKAAGARSSVAGFEERFGAIRSARGKPASAGNRGTGPA